VSGPWIRMPPRREDDLRALLTAGAVAACAGVVTFYLARVLLARERVGQAEGPTPAADLPPEGGDA